MNRILAVFYSLVFFFFSHQLQAQSEKISGKFRLTMIQARHEYLNNNFREALILYRQIHAEHPNNALINYRIGECHLALKNYDLAYDYFNNAKKIDESVDKDLYLNLGISLHRIGRLDEALSAFEKFKSVNKTKYVAQSPVEKYISQVHTAKAMMQNPVNVTIKNIGREINSRFDDYNPCITADGKTIIFTSRRPDTEGGRIDEMGDKKYYEDIYISQFDEQLGYWTDAEPIPGRINTKGHDASIGLSKDGKMLFVYRNDGINYIGDIFLSKYSSYSNKWSTPRPLSKTVNSTYFESSASITSDNEFLYFISERPKGSKGHGDIWVSRRISRYNWTEPINLGEPVNTSEDEISVFIHPDGRTLFFSSKGHKSMGGYDIFMSVLQDDSTWSEPVNLGYPINTVDDDVNFVISADYKTAFFSSVRKEGYGERDIYIIDLSNYDLFKSNNSKLSVFKGAVLKNDTNSTIVPRITVFDENNKKVSSFEVDEEDGQFYVTLQGDRSYKIKIEALGYQPIEEQFYLPYNADKMIVFEKNYKLNSQSSE